MPRALAPVPAFPSEINLHHEAIALYVQALHVESQPEGLFVTTATSLAGQLATTWRRTHSSARLTEPQ
jgi:hypothetical protein